MFVAGRVSPILVGNLGQYMCVPLRYGMILAVLGKSDIISGTVPSLMINLMLIRSKRLATPPRGACATNTVVVVLNTHCLWRSSRHGCCYCYCLKIFQRFVVE